MRYNNCVIFNYGHCLCVVIICQGAIVVGGVSGKSLLEKSAKLKKKSPKADCSASGNRLTNGGGEHCVASDIPLLAIIPPLPPHTHIHKRTRWRSLSLSAIGNARWCNNNPFDARWRQGRGGGGGAHALPPPLFPTGFSRPCGAGGRGTTRKLVDGETKVFGTPGESCARTCHRRVRFACTPRRPPLGIDGRGGSVFFRRSPHESPPIASPSAGAALRSRCRQQVAPRVAILWRPQTAVFRTAKNLARILKILTRRTYRRNVT